MEIESHHRQDIWSVYRASQSTYFGYNTEYHSYSDQNLNPEKLNKCFGLPSIDLPGENDKSFSPKEIMKDGFQAQAFRGRCSLGQILVDEYVSIEKGKILFSRMRNDCKQKISFDFKFMFDEYLTLFNPKYIEPCDVDVRKVDTLTEEYFKVKIMDSNIIWFHPCLLYTSPSPRD